MQISSILASIVVIIVKYNDHALKNGFIKTYLYTYFKKTAKNINIKKKKLIIAI